MDRAKVAEAERAAEAAWARAVKVRGGRHRGVQWEAGRVYFFGDPAILTVEELRGVMEDAEAAEAAYRAVE